MGFKQTYADAQRKQAIADALAGRAMTTQQHPQGRIAANTGLADGMTALMAALASRRTGKQATALTTQGDEERRKAQAAALGGFANPPNMVETPEAQSPYGRAQRALEADVDPNVVGAYLKQQVPDPSKSPFGVVDPSGFTPESLQKFATTHKYSDLVPINKMFGKYTPSNYTPESWAQFQASGDPAVLVRFAEREFKDTPGGGIIPVDPITGGQAGPAVLTTDAATKEAAARKEAEAKATATGTASVIPADRRLDAQAKEPRVEAAERRLDRVDAASTMLGSGGGPIEGRVRNFVGTPAAQELEAANAGLLDELTALTRTPGIGSQSDLEQRLKQLTLPNATQHPEVRSKTIIELRAFIRDLKQAINRVGGPAPQGSSDQQPGQASPQTNPSGSVNWADLK